LRKNSENEKNGTEELRIQHTEIILGRSFPLLVDQLQIYNTTKKKTSSLAGNQFRLVIQLSPGHE
jgi:hypothetical protein